MFKKLVILFTLQALILSSPVEIKEEYTEVLEASVVVVDDINNFKAVHPDVELTELKRVETASRATIRYTLGSRVVGDTLVATKSDFVNYGSPQNVKLTLTYPTSGAGAVVSHVLIDVQQSTSQGRGYVTQGGIGQRFIQIVIEAQATTYFGYSAFIYGKY